ncbi:hypothetical protein N4844_10425, partial [Enterococcus faecalis]|uniref:hypothetical protein n=1 Tax=Enterococcus faecalis TaxID=1351 RepID=UPI0021DF6E4F
NFATEPFFLLRYSFQLLLSDNNIYVTSVAYTKIRRINSVIVLFSKDYKGFLHFNLKELARNK